MSNKSSKAGTFVRTFECKDCRSPITFVNMELVGRVSWDWALYALVFGEETVGWATERDLCGDGESEWEYQCDECKNKTSQKEQEKP